MSLTLVVTNAGRAAIVNANRDGTNPVRVAAVGVSATAITASATTTTLPGEIKRITTIAGDAVAADTIHVTVRDETNASYSVRSIALYLADGTLFAAFGQSSVMVEKSAQALLLLALDVRFADIAAASLSFGATNFLNPAATTETAGVVELATDAETSAGTDDRRTVTPKGLSFALSARLASWGADIWRAGNDGAGSGLDADLLDGQQGSYYANIPARLGYTPASRAGDTFTGNVGVTNGAYFYSEPPAGSHGVMRFQRNGKVRWDIGMNITAEGGGNTGSDFFIHRFDDSGNFIDTSFLMSRSTGELRLQGGRAWHAANDGAGSGLDADLLDGQDGSYYANIAARLGYTPANRAGDDFVGGISAGTPNQGSTGGFRLRSNATSGFAYLQVTSADLSTEWGNLQFDAAGRMCWSGSLLVLGAVSRNGNMVWDAANDGSGSGLDADLLDGQQGSYYTNIIGRLGYTPANRAGDDFIGAISAGTPNQGTTGGLRLRSNATSGFAYLQVTNADQSAEWGNLQFDAAGRMRWSGSLLLQGTASRNGNTIWDAANDGAGSGLDADLLDGRQATDFALNASIGDVWRSSNDGAGSGLDADLLDGFQGAAYDRVVQQNLAENGGYLVYASGRKETWGWVSVAQDTYATYNLPVAHDEWVHPSLGVSSLSGNRDNYQNTGIADIIGSPPTAIQIWNADDRTARVWIRTIGK